MARSSRDLSIFEARRIALAAQGFHRPRPRKVDGRHIARTIHQLGLIQIDSVNVLVPAHYVVLFSRLGPYDRSRLDHLVYTRRAFTEQWAHEASIVPVERWPLLRPLSTPNDRRTRGLLAYAERHAAYMARVLDHVRARGPITAADMAEPDGTRGKSNGWWGWTHAKIALEAHFMAGTLAIAGRRAAGYAREYDLAERIVAAEHRTTTVDRADAVRQLVGRAALAHGVGTAKDLADYYRLGLREARAAIAELMEAGELRQVRVEGWKDAAYLHGGATLPTHVSAAALLSPFDPVVWYRPRTKQLFGLDYRIEIYTPAARRQWGYYVLPFLLGDELVARVDLKADRKASRLLVPAAHLEKHAKGGDVAEALAVELRAVARWLELEKVVVERRGSLARRLASALGTR